MWSEHCSYKSSKVHLQYFGETTTAQMRSKMLAGIGDNAGVVDIGDGWAVTFKVESHNHPSYVEPYQGAATGVGGIVRDILAMGARPVAVLDQLRFGPADAPDSQRVVPGIVAGVGGYGNSLGLPNIGGEVVFDPSYAGNPLVNAGAIGVLRAADLYTAQATGTGNKVILYGSATGLDGIGGASVLASTTFDDERFRAGAPQVAQCPGRRSVRREGAHRMHARGGRRPTGGGHPGPGRRRTGLCHFGTRICRRRRDARRPRPGAPAGRRHDRGGDPLQRIAGAHVCGGHAGQGGRVPGRLRQVGGGGRRDRRGDRHRAPGDHPP